MEAAATPADDRTLAQALHELRLEEVNTQRELAKRAGLSDRTIRNIEAGGGASDLTLIKIARAVDRPDYFNAFLSQPTQIVYGATLALLVLEIACAVAILADICPL